MDIIRKAAELEGLKIVDHKLVFNPGLEASLMPIKHIILHHDMWEGATMKTIHEDHLKKGWRGVGYNARIRTDGSIELGRMFGTIGAHCKGSMNFESVGIVFEGDFTNKKMSDIQMISGIKLISRIINLSQINIDNVEEHKIHSKTSCPGSKFPYEELINKIETQIEKNNLITEEKVSPWAVDAMVWGVEMGITDGTRPKDKCTREEVITMLHNYLTKL